MYVCIPHTRLVYRCAINLKRLKIFVALLFGYFFIIMAYFLTFNEMFVIDYATIV